MYVKNFVYCGNGIWYCRYDNGSIYDIKVMDFSPTGTSKGTDFSGTGAVAGANGDSNYQCYKIEVRQIDSNCMISFLNFSHGVPQFL
jgi:hypothetical protein